LSEEDKTVFGVTDADFRVIHFPIGQYRISTVLFRGRRPGSLSELDRAYLQKFKGGFKGLRWVVEPSMNYIEFDNDSPFRNSWLLGGYAVLILTPIQEYILSTSDRKRNYINKFR
jgi:hypothetical protein